MPVFLYKAVDSAGLMITGEIEKKNAGEVFEYINGAGLLAIEVKKAGVLNRDLLLPGFLKSTVKETELGIFCRQMAFLLEAGIPVHTAVSILHRQLPSGRFRDSLRMVEDKLQKGYSLGDALEENQIFPAFLVGMARVGELSGKQDTVFSQMADYYEKGAKTREELKSALLYPVLVALMMIGVIFVAVVFVVPNYAAMFASAGVELPFITRLLIQSSSFILQHYHIITIVPALIILGLALFYRTNKGRWFFHWLLLRLPVSGTVYRKMLNLNFAQTLGLLLESGVLLLQAVEMVKKVLNNSVMDGVLDNLTKGLADGKPLGYLMEDQGASKGKAAKGCFDPILCSMVRIGEETGSLPRLMMKSAEYFQIQADALLVRVNKLIEPVLILILGVVLGFIMLAILLPTFTLAYFV